MRRDGVVGTDSAGGLRLWIPTELTAANAAAWRSRVDMAWPREPRALIMVDAGGARFMDSAGIGWLIATRKRAMDEGRPFQAIGFGGPVRKVLRLARVDGFFGGG